MRIPTDQEIRALHAQHAPTEQAFELVYTHCEIVCEIAEQLITATSDLTVNAELVRAGSLLHDIGVYRLYTPAGTRDQTAYVRHGLLGHELLRDLGFPNALCRFCSHHTGMGLTRDDILNQELPLPAADYMAESDEEQLVMYADKFHSKTNPPTFLHPETYASSVARFGAEKVVRFEAMRARFGEPELAKLAGRHGHALA